MYSSSSLLDRSMQDRFNVGKTQPTSSGSTVGKDAAYSSLTQHSRRPFSLEREAPLQDQKQYTLPGRNADFNLTGISAEDRRKSNLKTRPDVTDNRSVYNRPSNSHGKYDETPDNLIAEKFNKKYGDMPDYRTGDGQLNNYGRNAELKMPEKGGDQHLSRMGKSMDLESLKKELDSRTSNTDRYKKFEVQGKQDDRRTSMMGQSLDFESRGKSPDRPGSSLERPGNFEVSSKSAHDDLNRQARYQALSARQSDDHLQKEGGYDALRSHPRESEKEYYNELPNARRGSLLERERPLQDKRRRGSGYNRGSMFEADNDDRTIKTPSMKNKRRKNKTITANLCGTRYEVIRHMADHLGMTISKDDDPNAYLIWNDAYISAERVSELKPYQKVNHFPGMGEITRKDSLARNMSKMQRHLPDDFNIVPKTWILPADYPVLQNYAKDAKTKKKPKTFITKPANGAQGHGISVFRNCEKIAVNEHYIVQEYIEKPLLIDGFKFDLRIYVLITSCDPLRIFMFNDGLVRLSTEKYVLPHESNVNRLYMHLTNYSVNKHSENYEKGTTIDTGSKRSIRYFNDYLRKNDYDVASLWKDISDIIVKAMIVAEPHVLHGYRMCRPGVPTGNDSVCFEVLGVDVLIDRKMRPWLLEINRSPSFGTDEKIDYDIKSSLVEDTIRLLNIRPGDKKRNMAAQKAESQKRLWRQSKRGESGDLSELEKRKQNIDAKKEELQEMLSRLRKDVAREDFENRNKGRFHRIFPSDDKVLQQKYVHLLSETFGVFMSGKGGSMQKEIHRVYNNTIREDQILDKIAELESGDGKGSSRSARGPKPLFSMPSSKDAVADRDDSDDSDDDSDEDGSPRMKKRPTSSVQSEEKQHTRTNNNSGISSSLSSRPNSVAPMGRRSRVGSAKALNASLLDENLLYGGVRSREDELTKKTLRALNDMRIKFPGKSDEEADWILNQLHENWKFHKPRIASYWLVKLDSIKRKKVVDIVRSNVRALLQKIWKCPDVDSLRLFRIFSRIFNRLLWSHGQGLWNCFSATGHSWETIFRKSTENITEDEMNCCRRIVQLCSDCLLIVYQFAADAKSSATMLSMETESQPTSGLVPSSDKKGWSASQPMSQRYSKLYYQRQNNEAKG